MNKFTQKAYILGKVKDMGIKEVRTESSGKENYILEVKMNLVPDNVYFTVSKFLDKAVVGDGSKRGDFFQSALDEFKSMMGQFKQAKEAGQDFFVSTSIKPSVQGKGKEQKTVMYDAIVSRPDSTGNIWFSASGFVSVVPNEVIEDSEGNKQTILKFKNKDVNVNDVQPTKIEATMIVADENQTQITLTSGGDFPKELEVMIKDSEVGKATIGQGYTFILGFDKIEVEDADGEQDWDEEAKPSFAKNVIVVKKVLGKVTGYVLEDGYNDSDDYNNY